MHDIADVMTEVTTATVQLEEREKEAEVELEVEEEESIASNYRAVSFVHFYRSPVCAVIVPPRTGEAKFPRRFRARRARRSTGNNGNTIYRREY